VTKNIGNNKIVCLIPARKGSKRIQDKNLKKINGKPLIYYAYNAANISKIHKIYLATTSKKIIPILRGERYITLIPLQN